MRGVWDAPKSTVGSIAIPSTIVHRARLTPKASSPLDYHRRGAHNFRCGANMAVCRRRVRGQRPFVDAGSYGDELIVVFYVAPTAVKNDGSQRRRCIPCQRFAAIDHRRIRCQRFPTAAHDINEVEGRTKLTAPLSNNRSRRRLCFIG